MARGKKLELVISGNARGAIASLAALDAQAGRTGSPSGGIAKAGSRAGVAFAAIGAAAGAAAVGAGIALFKIGSEFDKAYDKIRIGTGATGDQLEGLKDSFRAVAAEVPASFGDIGTAIADLNTRTGATGGLLENLATQMLNVSRITGTDITTNIANLTRVFGDWGISTDDQAERMDQIFRASQATGAGLDVLAGQVVQFGAPMRSLGFTLEESLAIFGQFEQAGVNIETTMAGMRMAVARFARDGVDPMQGMADVMAGVEAGTFTMTDAIDTFGQRAANDMFRALQEGKFNIGELVDQISNGSDTINAAAADTDDAGEKFTLLKNRIMLALEPLAATVFDGVGQAMDALGPKISEFVTAAAPTLQRISEAVGVWLPEAMAFVQEKAEEVWPVLRDMFTEISRVVEENWPQIRDTVVEVMDAVSEAISAAVELVGTLWERFGDDWLKGIEGAIGPLLQVISGAVNVISGIIKAWSAIFKGDWSAVWDAVKQVWGGALDVLVGLLRAGWNFIVGIVRVGGELFGQVWAGIWDGIKAKASEIWDGLVAWFTEGVGRFMFPFATLLSWLPVEWGNVWNAVWSLLSFVWDQITGRVGFAVEYLSTTIGTALGVIRDNWNTVWGAISAVTALVWGAISGHIGRAIEGVKSAVRLGVQAISSIWGGLKGAFSSVANWIITNAINPFIRAVNRVASAIGIGNLLRELGTIGGGASVGNGGEGSEGAIGPRYHTGGVVAGRGEQPATLLGGEGVLPLDVMRRMSAEQFELLRQGRMTEAFGDGFGLGSIRETLSNAVGGVIDSVRSVIANVARPMVEGALGMIGQVAPGVPGDMFGGAARMVGNKVLDWISGADEIAKSIAPTLGPGVGYQAMFDAIKKRFPWATLISGSRPGAITATGNPSMHGKNRAVDVDPSMEIFDWIHGAYGPMTHELIFSPAGGRQIYRGRPHMYGGVTRDMHWDHVHWSMDEGGYGTTSGRPTMMHIGSNVKEDFAFVPHSKGGLGGTTVVKVDMSDTVIIGSDGPDAVVRALEEALRSGKVLGPATKRALGL